MSQLTDVYSVVSQSKGSNTPVVIVRAIVLDELSQNRGSLLYARFKPALHLVKKDATDGSWLVASGQCIQDFNWTANRMTDSSFEYTR
jgi:hypothetical protein